MYKIRYKDKVRIGNPLIEYKDYMEYTGNYMSNIIEFRENINDYIEGNITLEELEESFNILNKDRVEQIKTMIGILYKGIYKELTIEIAKNIIGMMVRELSVYQYMDDIYEEEFGDLEKKDTVIDKPYIKYIRKYLENYVEEDDYIGSYCCDIVSYKEMMDNIRNLYKERKPLISKLKDENGKVLSLDEKDMISTYLKGIDIIEFDINFWLEKIYAKEHIKELAKSNSEKGLKTFIFYDKPQEKDIEDVHKKEV